MIADGMIIPDSGKPINIFVGIHQWVEDHLLSDAMNIGIQTEQLVDADGRKLWGKTSPFLTLIYLSKYDIVIDINIPDATEYPSWVFWGNSLFGPYLFSRKKNEPIRGDGDYLLFIGTKNARRSEQLQKISASQRITSLSHCSRHEADDQIRKCTALLNIHYSKGRYTEWPRLLMACLGGKILVSEELDHPLLPGVHYLPVGSIPDEAQIAEIFGNITRDIAERYRFDMLLSVFPDKKRYCLLRSLATALLVWMHFRRADIRKKFRCLKKRLRRQRC